MFLPSVDKNQSFQTLNDSAAMTPVPDPDADNALMSVASQAAASGSSQSGNTVVLVEADRSNDFVVRPHGSAKISGLAPEPTSSSSLVPGRTVGFAMIFP